MSSGSALLLSSINKFYKQNPEYMDKLVDIIEGKSKISLRVIDWLVTHYAKRNNIVYWVNDDNKDICVEVDKNSVKSCRKFRLYEDYRVQLKSFTKMYFDPFRRHNRITCDGVYVETTIGQLNFFKWVFKNGVLLYIERHLDKITKDMSKYNKSNVKTTKKSVNQITKELSMVSFR